MTDLKRHICRVIRKLPINLNSSNSFLPVLGLATFISFLPAFFYGCCPPQEQSILPAKETLCLNITKSQDCLNLLDICVFHDDVLQKIDCYQRIPNPAGWNGEVVSSYGDRIIAVCANSSFSYKDWAEVNSYASMKNMRYRIEEEQAGYPFMSGYINAEAGQGGRKKDVQMKPLFSEIVIRSIVCDFSDRPYAGEKLTDVSFYLTNVNADCGIFAEEPVLPERIINAGRRCWEEIEGFKEPSMVSYDYLGTIGNKVVRPDIKLRCYPNNSAEESPGSPFTRLVIEGKIQGQTYYWPIDINREGTGNGIGRNRRYIYDIEITRKGSDDPDIPVRTEMINIKLEVEQWKEKEEYGVIF